MAFFLLLYLGLKATLVIKQNDIPICILEQSLSQLTGWIFLT